jgi:hypothetical protein
MRTDAVAALFARFEKLSPADQLRLAAGLIDRGGREHYELAGQIARRVSEEITLGTWRKDGAE